MNDIVVSLELLVVTNCNTGEVAYCVEQWNSNDTTCPEFRFPSKKRAVLLFSALVDTMVNEGYTDITTLPVQNFGNGCCISVGSPRLRSLISKFTGNRFDTSALGLLQSSVWCIMVSWIETSDFDVSDSISKIVSAETALFQARSCLNNNDDSGFEEAIKVFYQQFSIEQPAPTSKTSVLKRQLISTGLRKVRLLKDIYPLVEKFSEMMSPASWQQMALMAPDLVNCNILPVSNDLDDYKSLVDRIPSQYNVKNIWKLERFTELGHLSFEGCPNDRNLLFHSTLPENVLGILNRGLLMPRVVEECLGFV